MDGGNLVLLRTSSIHRRAYVGSIPLIVIAPYYGVNRPLIYLQESLVVPITIPLLAVAPLCGVDRALIYLH